MILHIFNGGKQKFRKLTRDVSRSVRGRELTQFGPRRRGKHEGKPPDKPGSPIHPLPFQQHQRSVSGWAASADTKLYCYVFPVSCPKTLRSRSVTSFSSFWRTDDMDLFWNNTFFLRFSFRTIFSCMINELFHFFSGTLKSSI